MPDADAHAVVLVAHVRGDGAQPVVAGVAAANFHFQLGWREVDLVVKDVDVADFDFQEARGIADRAAAVVHVGRWLQQHDALAAKRAFRRLAMEALAPGAEAMRARRSCRAPCSRRCGGGGHTARLGFPVRRTASWARPGEEEIGGRAKTAAPARLLTFSWQPEPRPWPRVREHPWPQPERRRPWRVPHLPWRHRQQRQGPRRHLPRGAAAAVGVSSSCFTAPAMVAMVKSRSLMVSSASLGSVTAEMWIERPISRPVRSTSKKGGIWS